MSEAFACPKCGAPQQYSGSGDTIQCPYCETTIIVPKSLRTRSGIPSGLSLGAGDWTRQANALIEIKRLSASGQKIEAIKLYRETFHAGLKEAKDAVEAIERGENVQMAQITVSGPGAFQVGTDGSNIQISRTASGGINISTSERKTSRSSLGCIIAFVVIIIILTVVVPLVGVGGGLFVAFNEVNRAVTGLEYAGETPVAIVQPTPAPTRTTVPSPTPTPGFASVSASFGAEGTGPGKFQDARSIGLDNNGHIYVAEYTGGRIQRLSADGKFLSQWNVDPKIPLRGFAADRKGNVYVVQSGVISRYNGESGEHLGTLKIPGSNGFDQVVAAPDGTLWATWYEERTGIITSAQGHRDDLVHFDTNGKVLGTIKGAISGQTGDAETNNQIAVDGQGNVFVLGGTFDPAMFKFSRDGKFVSRFGSRGKAAGQFNSPDAIAVDGKSRVYVADGNKVLVYASDGRYLDTFQLTGVGSGMVFDDDDGLWIAARTKVLKLRLNR